MISHLKIFNAEILLLGQRSKLNDLPAARPPAKALRSSLGRSCLLNVPTFIQKKLAHHYFGTDRVIATLSDLADRWESFSITFCIEKDNVNHAFRALIDVYLTAITSNYQEITFSSVLIFPSAYVVRFINHYFEVWWLP